MLTNPISPMQKLVGAIVAVAILAGGGHFYRQHVYQQGYDKAVADRAGRDAVAVLRRTEENVVAAEKNTSINNFITKAKYEELAPVRERIVTERVYVGSAICGSAGATEADLPGGGDGTNPPGRLVRSDIERDIVALKLAVEDDLATGRACQAAAREKGLAP